MTETKKNVPLKRVLGREVAELELNKWFDALEVPEEDRIDIDKEKEEKPKKDVMREKVLKALMSGRLILNDEGLLEYTLKSPLVAEKNGNPILEKVTFKMRYREHELEGNMRGVDSDEFLPMTRAYVATLTGVSKSILGKLWNTDTSIMQAIYTLFTRGDA